MTIDDFLKVKQVRCVKAYGDCLTVGKAYGVIDIRIEVKVKDDEGDNYYWESDHFEPVLEPAENPLQDMELTPEFEAVEPKFKVGDKVYYGNRRYLLDIIEIRGCMVRVRNGNYLSDAHINYLCHATQENYEMLCKLYPHIEFEKPLKPLTGSDLARAMLDKGWKYVPCYVSNYGESEAQKPCIVRKFSSSGQFVSEFEFYNNAVPFDPRTGEPLTESILND